LPRGPKPVAQCPLLRKGRSSTGLLLRPRCGNRLSRWALEEPVHRLCSGGQNWPQLSPVDHHGGPGVGVASQSRDLLDGYPRIGHEGHEGVPQFPGVQSLPIFAALQAALNSRRARAAQPAPHAARAGCVRHSGARAATSGMVEIGAVAEALGISVRTARQYIKDGLMRDAPTRSTARPTGRLGATRGRRRCPRALRQTWTWRRRLSSTRHGHWLPGYSFVT